MKPIQHWSIRRRLLLALLGALLPYLALATIGGVGFHYVFQDVSAIYHEASSEAKAFSDLQIALSQLGESIERFRRSPGPAERLMVEQRVEQFHAVVSAMEVVSFDHAEERELAAIFKSQDPAIENLAREVLERPGATETAGRLHQLIGDLSARLDFIRAFNAGGMVERHETIARMARRISLALLAALLLSVAGGVGLAFLFSRWLSRPIQAIVGASRRMAEGDLSQRVSAGAGGEVGQVARAFNEMAARVAESRASLEGRIAELAALQKIGADLASTLHLPAVLEAFAESAIGLIGASRCAVFELNPADQRLHARGSRGMRADQPFMPMRLGQGAVGSAALLRRTVFSPDVHREPLPMYDEEWEGTGKTLRELVRQRGYRSVLAVPLISKENVLGAICIYWDEAHAYDEREVRLLTAVAQQAAVAIENARLHEEAQARRRVAEALAAVGRELAQSLDLVTVGRRITDSIRELLGVNSSALWRLEPESGNLIGLAASGETDPIFDSGIALPQGTGLVSFAIRERRLAVSPNLLTDPRITLTPEMRARTEQTEFRAVLAIPLIIKERVIGALAAGDREGRVFSQEEISLAQAFADQAALALENARLYDEVQAHRLQLADRVRDLEDALARVQQLQGLLPICAWCKKVRRDENYWQSVEGYVAEHSEVRFSHGICPDCKEKLALRRESHG